MGKYYKIKQTFWCYLFKILGDIPNSANNKKTKGCFETYFFYKSVCKYCLNNFKNSCKKKVFIYIYNLDT